jgi:hypothetical protein
MNPILASIEAALTVLEKLLPLLDPGTVTAAQQQALLDRLARLRLPGAFTAPHWRPKHD